MAKIGRSRAKRLVLDVGSSAIRLCELSQTKTGYQLTKYYQREALVDPLLDEASKRIIRVNALKDLLKEAKISSWKSRRRTIVGVPGRSVFTRTRTLPPVPDYKVMQIVRYEIQQQIPFALDQIALGYQTLSRTEAGGYDVMMAAIKVDVVEKHLEILQEANCFVDTVDICPLAAYNWLKYAGEFGTEGECVALLDMGAATTDIIIERQNQFRFTRPLPLGGDDITSALRDAFGLNFADAEKLKRERGFAPSGDAQRDGKMGEVIGQVLAKLVTEVSRSFSYFRSLPGGGMIDRVVVTGGGACLRNIVPYLKRQTNLDVRIARPLAGLAIAPSAQEINEHPEQAAVVLGMALRTCQTVSIEINLIPSAIIESARRREQIYYWAAAFVILGFIALSIIPARAQKDKQVRERIQTVKRYVAAYDPVLAENPGGRVAAENDLEEAKRQVGSRLGQLGVLSRAYSNATFWLNGLKVLNNARPDGGKVWYSSIETIAITPGGKDKPNFPALAPTIKGAGDKKEVVPPPVANAFRIFGYAKDPDTLTLFINQLRAIPMFSAGVDFNEASVMKAPIWELDTARTSLQAASTQSPSGSAGRPALGSPGNTQEEFVYFFCVTVQFASAAPPPAPSGGAGASKFDPAAFGKTVVKGANKS